MHGLSASNFVDDNMKMVSFNFVKKQGQQNLFRIVVQTFDLIASKHLFIEPIKELVADHYYKEVKLFKIKRMLLIFVISLICSRLVNGQQNYNYSMNFQCLN